MKTFFRKSINWSFGIAVITLVLAAIFSVVSTFLLSGLTWSIGVIVVLAIVLFGITFDIIGVAATAADESPYHAMASKRLHGSKQAIFITRNADRVASFCNDVIGDISGIVSGTASAAVVIQLSLQMGYQDGSAFQGATAVIFTSLIAALTVGGKAFGKSFAIHYSNDIIFQVGRLVYFAEDKLKIKITYRKRKKPQNRK
jgi:CBS domain containing-hemolysin-like protein